VKRKTSLTHSFHQSYKFESYIVFQTDIESRFVAILRLFIEIGDDARRFWVSS